jgi:hypothetical protein
MSKGADVEVVGLAKQSARMPRGCDSWRPPWESVRQRSVRLPSEAAPRPTTLSTHVRVFTPDRSREAFHRVAGSCALLTATTHGYPLFSKPPPFSLTGASSGPNSQSDCSCRCWAQGPQDRGPRILPERKAVYGAVMAPYRDPPSASARGPLSIPPSVRRIGPYIGPYAPWVAPLG